MARSRRWVGLLTLLTLLAILVGVTGFELPSLPSGGGGGTQTPPLAGIRAVGASTLVRVGSGAPPGSELAFLAIEPVGNLVVSDSRRHTVMRFDTTGHLLSEWGPDLGDSVLGEPAGVAVQGDAFYVVDRGTPRVFRLDVAGRVQAVISLESLGTYGLNGLAVEPGGNLYVADTGRNRVLVLAPNGSLLRQIGHPGGDLGGLTQPMMLAFASDGSFVVADWENGRLERWDPNLEATDSWSFGSHPFGVGVDQSGRVYVPDTEHRRILAYTPHGAPLGEMGGPDSAPLDVAPRQIALSRSDPPQLYALGGDGLIRLDLENTPAPPQGTSDVDLVSLVVIAAIAAALTLAILARRARRGAALLRPAPGWPIRLNAEDGAQRQHQ